MGGAEMVLWVKCLARMIVETSIVENSVRPIFEAQVNLFILPKIPDLLAGNSQPSSVLGEGRKPVHLNRAK